MNFGQGMRMMRALRGMSQIELSVLSSVNRDYLQKSEAGTLELKDAEKAAIRKALDWNEAADELLEAAAAGKVESPCQN
jgi:transcriptional regulator with XRE-family HTH domain